MVVPVCPRQDHISNISSGEPEGGGEQTVAGGWKRQSGRNVFCHRTPSHLKHLRRPRRQKPLHGHRCHCSDHCVGAGSRDSRRRGLRSLGSQLHRKGWLGSALPFSQRVLGSTLPSSHRGVPEGEDSSRPARLFPELVLVLCCLNWKVVSLKQEPVHVRR